MAGIERRVCPLRGCTVILDPSRAQAPFPWVQRTVQAPVSSLETLYELDGTRVVANPRPLLVIEAPDSPAGLGANEVILHGSGSISAVSIRSVLQAARSRAHDLAQDPRLQHTLWIWERGHGRVPQPHSQLFTSPEPWPGRDWNWSALEQQQRLAQEQGRMVDGVHLPWAPQVAFEAWIICHDILELAERTARWLDRMGRVLGVPLTLCWQPLAQPSLISVQPRLRPASGLSLAGGVAHHGVPSELAVDLLRRSL
ncbi:MAG: hypothetical protein ACI9VR_001494 [Cognaticolwellia sp.]|jgi:hypothetical protein